MDRGLVSREFLFDIVLSFSCFVMPVPAVLWVCTCMGMSGNCFLHAQQCGLANIC